MKTFEKGDTGMERVKAVEDGELILKRIEADNCRIKGGVRRCVQV